MKHHRVLTKYSGMMYVASHTSEHGYAWCARIAGFLKVLYYIKTKGRVVDRHRVEASFEVQKWEETVMCVRAFVRVHLCIYTHAFMHSCIHAYKYRYIDT